MNGLVAVRLEEIGGSTARGVVGQNVTVGFYEGNHPYSDEADSCPGPS